MTDSEKLSFLVEAVTKQDRKMDALEKNLKEEIQGVRSELKEEIQGVRSELKEEIQEVRSELKEEIQGVRSELKEEIQGVRSELKEKIQGVQSELKEEIQKVQDDVTGVKLIMENELRRNISIIAENHLDLYEKLSEYKKVTDEQFHLSMRVNTLESYVKELRKERTA